MIRALTFSILLLIPASLAPALSQSLPPGAQGIAPPDLDSKLAELSLACITREYPNKPSEIMAADKDFVPARQRHPLFYGCFDWHSAVHSHWMLTRLIRQHPDAPYAAAARTALNAQFSPERIAGETAYFLDPVHADYERPYGLAWFLTLMAELRDWKDPDAIRWKTDLAPLEAAIAANLTAWLPRLNMPNRAGLHGGTSFPLSMLYDWARSANDPATASLVRERVLTLYGADKNCPLNYEPSAADFLSPCLAEADLMRRVMPPEQFSAWLTKFLPEIPKQADAAALWLTPAISPDRGDPWFVHLDGLNISRAWTLAGIADGLPPGDRRRPALYAAARIHADAGISALSFQSYEGNHWLGSFVMYLQDRAGANAPLLGLASR